MDICDKFEAKKHQRPTTDKVLVELNQDLTAFMSSKHLDLGQLIKNFAEPAGELVHELTLERGTQRQAEIPNFQCPHFVDSVRLFVLADWFAITSLASGYKLRFGLTFWESLSAPTIQSVTDHVSQLLASGSAADCKAVLLVGGFGESPQLQSKLRHARFSQELCLLMMCLRFFFMCGSDFTHL